MTISIEQARKIVAAADHVNVVHRAIQALKGGDVFRHGSGDGISALMGGEVSLAVSSALRVDRMGLEARIKTEVRAWVSTARAEAEAELRAAQETAE
jgi:hypothetical protein